ncbi:MAG TPA: outer membrane lipoprotein-sorting protein [Acidobacteriaceae bacterium]
MNKNWIRTLTLCFCALLSSQTPMFAADAPSARTIMEGVYRQDTSHDISMRASFQIYDAQGHSTKKEFTYRRLGSPGDSKTLVVFTAPKEIRGVALLSVNQHAASVRQYMYTPATQRVRTVAEQERTARFIGTDFTFEDIGERVLDDFSYRLLGDTETMDGHKTYKVEATPEDSSRSQYKFVYYWVAQDAPVILFAEMYDAQGQKVRVLHATDLKREKGIWGARNTEISTVREGTRTVLRIDEVKFNTNLDEKLFTPEGLPQAAVPDAGK